MEKVKKIAKGVTYIVGGATIGYGGFLAAGYAYHNKKHPRLGAVASGLIYGLSAFGYVGLAKRASEV